MSTNAGGNDDVAVSQDEAVMSSQQSPSHDTDQSKSSAFAQDETTSSTEPTASQSLRSRVRIFPPAQSSDQAGDEAAESKTGSEVEVRQAVAEARQLQVTLSAEAEASRVVDPETKREREIAAQLLYETATFQDVANMEPWTEAQWTTISDALLQMLQELSTFPGYQNWLRELIQRLAATLPKTQVFVMVKAIMSDATRGSVGAPKAVKSKGIGVRLPAKEADPDVELGPAIDGWRANAPVAVPREDVERPVRRKGAIEAATLEQEDNLD